MADAFRYAELANGKMLKFPKDTPDEEVKKAVRRHLGITQDDVISAVERLVDKIDALVEQIKKQADRNAKSQKELVEAVTDSFDANAGRLTAALADAVENIAKDTAAVREHLLVGIKEIAEEREERPPRAITRIPLGGYVR